MERLRPAPYGAGLRVTAVRVEHTPGHVAVTVKLTRGTTTLTARIDRPAVESQGVQVAAEAALEAIRQVMPRGARLVLHRAVSQAMTAGAAVITHIVAETQQGQEHLVGSALSRGGPLEDAAVEAVVDAVDRRLTRYLQT